MASALVGFYSSVRMSGSFRNGAPGLPDDLNVQEPPQPSPPDAASPAGPLDFLSDGTSQRPASVETLIEEAKRVTQRLVESFPNDPGAYDMVARLHNTAGDPQEAVRAWEKSLDLNADYSYAYQGLASAALERGENEKAIHLFRRALVLTPDSFNTQIQLAQALIDVNRMEEAIRLLDVNVATDPRPYRGRVLLGMAYMHLEEYQKAKENYEAAIAAHPKHANAHFGLATACARLGQHELHQKYLAKFRELRAGEREIAAGQRHQFDDLDTMCARVAQIYADAAKICLTHANPREAEILCRRAAVLDPRNVECRQALAWMFLERGKHTDTIRMFEELARIDPGNVSYRLEIARLHAAMGRLPAAEQTLRRVCDEAPENPAGYVALTNFLLQRHRNLQEAVESAQTAVRLDPSVSNQALLSTACEQSGDIRKAIEAMAEAVKRAPNDVRYQQMYELLKEREEEE